MGKTMLKTTIEIEKDLLYRAKIKALQENKSLKFLVNEGLAAILDGASLIDDSTLRGQYGSLGNKKKTPTPEEIGIIPGNFKLKKKHITRDDIYSYLDEKESIV